MTIWNIVIWAAMLQGFLLAAFLLANKKGQRRANSFLALLVFLYSIDIGLETLYASAQISAYTYLIGINDPLFFLYGPLLYLYAYFLSSQTAVVQKKWLLHFLPFLLIVGVYTPAFYLQSAEAKLLSEGVLPPQSISGAGSFISERVRGLVELASGFHQLIYVVLTLLLLRRHESAIKESFSVIERLNLGWLRNLTLATGVIIAVDILLFFFVQVGAIQFEKAVTVILFLVAVLIYAIGYMGLRQPTIFSQVAVAPAVSEEAAFEKKEKYYKSALTEQQAEDNLAKLLKLMEEEKPYLDGELKLSDIAETLGISNNTLSQVINEKLQKNFYDFINDYRIATAQKLLLNPRKSHLTLLAIAFESGFNSKSSFNSVFKKQCQATPSEFRKAASAQTSV